MSFIYPEATASAPPHGYYFSSPPKKEKRNAHQESYHRYSSILGGIPASSQTKPLPSIHPIHEETDVSLPLLRRPSKKRENRGKSKHKRKNDKISEYQTTAGPAESTTTTAAAR